MLKLPILGRPPPSQHQADKIFRPLSPLADSQPTSTNLSNHKNSNATPSQKCLNIKSHFSQTPPPPTLCKGRRENFVWS